MSLWNRYLDIQKLKNVPSLCVEGINYAFVIAVMLYDRSLIGRLKKIFFAVFFKTEFSSSGSSADVVLLYSCRQKGRDDYDYIYSYLCQACSEKGARVEAVEKVSFIQALQTLAHLRVSFFFVPGDSWSVVDRVLIACLVAKYRVSLKSFYRSVDFGARQVLVTFCDAMPVENMAAQAAKAKGLFTVTNQHGQYRVLDESNMSADAEAYANFVSDRLLCWGEATRREFIKYGFSGERCYVSGWIKRPRERVSRIPLGGNVAIGVMLNGENGKKSNSELIQWARFLAKALGRPYIVRLHPANNPQEYQSQIDEGCMMMARLSSSEYYSKVQVSLAHMTGGVVESLELGSPIYLMDDGMLADVFRVEGLSFCSTDLMLAAVNRDFADPCLALRRIEGLKRFFNDDDLLELKVKNGLKSDRSSDAVLL